MAHIWMALVGIALKLSFSFAIIPIDYMTDNCGSVVHTVTSRRLESSTALAYKPNLDCTFSVTTSTSRRVMVLVRRFQLENAVAGACADYVNIHDGLTADNATILNPSPLCGRVFGPSDFTSTGDAMTVRFVTDARAQDKGFELVFVSVATGDCGADYWPCASGVCIHSSLRCDKIDHCPDWSDETKCVDEEVVTASVNVGLIVGVCVGLAVVIATVAIVIAAYRHYKWRRFLLDSEILPDVAIKDPEPTYPVTWKYWRQPIILGKYGHVFQWGIRNDGLEDGLSKKVAVGDNGLGGNDGKVNDLGNDTGLLNIDAVPIMAGTSSVNNNDLNV